MPLRIELRDNESRDLLINELFPSADPTATPGLWNTNKSGSNWDYFVMRQSEIIILSTAEVVNTVKELCAVVAETRQAGWTASHNEAADDIAARIRALNIRDAVGMG